MEQKHRESTTQHLNYIAASADLIGAVERPGLGHFVNGSPIKTPELVKKANSLRKADDIEQVGPPEWRV